MRKNILALLLSALLLCVPLTGRCQEIDLSPAPSPAPEAVALTPLSDAPLLEAPPIHPACAAMLLAEAALRAVETVGMPDARLPLAQAIIAVCESPKSNSVAAAIDAAMQDAATAAGAVPLHLRDTHYAGHVRLDSGKGYLYPHDFPGHWVQQQYLPDEYRDRVYYRPSDQGHEAKIKKRKDQI